MVTGFHLAKETGNFQRNPHFICFQGFFRGCQKISLTFGLKQMFYYDVYCSYQIVFTQVDVTIIREALSVVCHCE